PLRSHLDPARRWVISPDGALWLVPWQALLLENGRYAVEDHLIHLVVSGRDLVSSRQRSSTAPPAILANPDFDLDPRRARAESHQRLGKSADPPAGQSGSKDLMRGTVLGARALPLPYTAAEADLVAPLLAKYAGADADVYTSATASE